MTSPTNDSTMAISNKDVQWAINHDWFVTSYTHRIGHTVIVVSELVANDTTGEYEYIQFPIHTVQLLRAWAGY